jgi:PAS domain S-box-containing protein
MERNKTASKGKTDRIIGTGEMAGLVRDYDWGATSLGPIELWSKELLTIVNLTLASASPTRAMWGSKFILIYNDAYRQIPGPRHPWALGRPASEVYSESWATVGPLLEKAFTTGETLFHEKLPVSLPTEGGIRQAYLNYAFNPIFEDGKIAGLFGPLHDVTGEVIAARNLLESEARATRILQSIGDAVIVTDADALITRMNPIAEQMTGWKETEAVGLPLADVFRIANEETRETVESPAERVRRLGSIVGLANHTILTARDGTEIHIDDSAAPIRDQDGGLTGIVLVFRNIDERRATEIERDAITRRLNQVLEVTSDAIVSVNRDWTMTFTNPRAKEIYGDVVGNNVWEAFPGAVYEGSPYTEHYYRAMHDRVSGDFEAYYPAPLDVWLHIMVHPTADGIVTFSHDITQRKRAEAVLVQSEKLAAVGRLASSIAHEINNPLEAVTNLFYLARTTDDLDQVKSYLSTAEGELRRVAEITNQTLRFSRKAALPTEVRPADLFTNVLTLHDGRLRNVGVQVERRDKASRPCSCYEGELRQVLSNLVGNAVDAMQSTGGRLLIRTSDGIDYKTGELGVRFTVADTGTGMDQQTVNKIFEAFFTTKETSGTGLGLWISKDIIDRHRGRVAVRSAKGNTKSGTVFVLFLPMAIAKL